MHVRLAAHTDIDDCIGSEQAEIDDHGGEHIEAAAIEIKAEADKQHIDEAQLMKEEPDLHRHEVHDRYGDDGKSEIAEQVKVVILDICLPRRVLLPGHPQIQKRTNERNQIFHITHIIRYLNDMTQYRVYI